MDTNPVKRNREFLGLSINELSLLTNVHRQVIIRAEQGCYAKIPERLHAYLIARLGDGYPTLNDDYSHWVHQKRLSSFGALVHAMPETHPEKHPFVLWREVSGINRIGICKLFCVHPSTLTRFETNLTMQSVPEQLYTALTNSGYDTHLLDELSIRYKLYRRNKLRPIAA